MNSDTPIIPLPDFQRISNTAAGLILSESGRLIGKCVLFGIMGEWLLREKYKISDARAVVGSFGVCVSKSNVIAFAGHQGTADNRENFHCWVEAAGLIFRVFYTPILRANILVPSAARLCSKSMRRRSLIR